MTTPTISSERSLPHRADRTVRPGRALPMALVVGALVGAACGLVLLAAVGGDADPPAPTAVVSAQPSVPAGAELDESPQRPAYLIIQDEIDRALTERDQRP